MFVGLELTFANNYTRQNFTENSPVSIAAVDAFDNYILNLDKMFSAMEGQHEVKLTSEFTKNKQKDFGGATANAKNLRVYVACQPPMRAAPAGFKKDVWSFNVSIDPQVIEVQTDPAWWLADRPEEDAVNSAYELIFDVMRKVPLGNETLAPDPQRGGGHVNIDAATAGLASPNDLLKMMILWEQHRTPNLDLIEVSSQTQAVLNDSRYKDVFRPDGKDTPAKANALAGEFMALIDSKPSWSAAIKAIGDLFYLYPQLGILKDGPGCIKHQHIAPNSGQEPEARKLLIHNQAINIEHLEVAGNNIGGRLEFREFRAQNDVDEAAQCIEICRTLIAKAKRQ